MLFFNHCYLAISYARVQSLVNDAAVMHTVYYSYCLKSKKHIYKEATAAKGANNT